jgi:hypothetical protein
MTHGGATSVKASCPININKASQIERRIGMEVDAKTKCTFEATQNAFNDLEVSITWRVHKLTDLLNRIRDVWPCKCEVLKSSH